MPKITDRFDYSIFGQWGNGKNKSWTETIGKSDRQNIRSKFPPGIAAAMAEQWGNYLLKECD